MCVYVRPLCTRTPLHPSDIYMEMTEGAPSTEMLMAVRAGQQAEQHQVAP